MGAVHVAVTRQIKPGCVAEYEKALHEFARESLREPGTTGVHLFEPVPGGNGCEYGILRSFESEEASRRFYDSEIFHHWQQRVGGYNNTQSSPPIHSHTPVMTADGRVWETGCGCGV